MYEVAEGYSFNWDKIVSDNLANEITEYKLAKSKGQMTPFYICIYHEFYLIHNPFSTDELELDLNQR